LGCNKVGPLGKLRLVGRANQFNSGGGIFHLTHRCHNRAFLLKFARDRDAYRAIVREQLEAFEVWLLDYCVTSNHVHLLLDAEDRLQISGLMRNAAGEFARAYNRRKGRMNAFWGDNFHATLVEEGRYLWRCLCYVELNMVRCGVVSHPKEWEWVGYHEIMGQRRRYRLLDLDRLYWRLGTDDAEKVRRHLEAALSDAIARGEVKREPIWTESLAVGSAGFVEKSKPMVLTRRETEVTEVGEGVSVLQETPLAYGQELTPKSARNAVL
jgi:Transposase and inactivated derivatives